MLKKIKHITLVVSLIMSGALASTLKDIKYDPKGNGLMLSIEYSDPIPDDNIIGWKSDRNWLYITLLGVKHSNEIVPKSDPNNLIKELVIDSFDESVQIALLLTRKIHWYDIINSKNSAIVFIHTEMKNDLRANLKRHIDRDGKSVFSEISQEGFPTYNTNFQAAFNKAREELGPNAIFKFKGKLYHTNHPNEVGDNTISSLENDKIEFQIDDYFSKYADTFSRDEKSNRNQNINDSNVDEYFIEKESGQELSEWSDLTDSKDAGSSLTLWDKMTAAKENDERL